MRWAAVAAILALASPAAARDNKDDDDEDTDDGDKKPVKKKGDDKKEKAESSDDDAADKKETEPKKEGELQKQDLNGHDLGTAKKDNVFENGRFFVDKVDEGKGTLVQGSITSTSFFFAESGGAYPEITPGTSLGDNAAKYSREFTDLRLQTDFRHIGGGQWEGRFDGRIRFVNSVTNVDMNSAEPSHIQSGFNGTNEYEIKEAWLVRNGVQSDVFIGRQFVPDLGAVKIDGVRIDYASSPKFTYIGFGGLYPIRGSRSITTDYQELKNADGTSAGQFTAAGGFGAAYRTTNAYGAVGGVAMLPFQGESARVYGTSNGYWRYGSSLDIYHFAIIDLLGSNAVNGGLTNLSAGINYKPSQRLRLTANVNRVDTDTLNLQANAFLNPADTTVNGVVQNEVYVARLATTQARGGVSAGLGDLQRYEISTAITYRYRPAFDLRSPDGEAYEGIKAAKGVDVYGSFTDRHSYKDMRLGFDVVRTFGVGNATEYQRSEVLALRGFAARELENGHGEWEAEASYASSKDSTAGMPCALTVTSCFGASSTTIFSLGGTLYYRFNQNWLGIASLFLNHSSTETSDGTGTTSDPGINGVTGFGRIAYRF
jgi:hypothetical protein